MNENTNWCRQLFATLANGGAWAVPRSGLTFAKRGDGLVLTSRAPYTGDNKAIAADWKAYQQDDYEVIKEQFALAGITVTEEDT